MFETLTTKDGARYGPSMSASVTSAAQPLEIRLFGGLEVRRDGEVVALPQSRKTRALLAYLILKGAPQRRDALCELLWEIPDDPRAALRWSMSKLRPIVNDDRVERLTADRERTGFTPGGAVIDALRLERACADGLEKLPTKTLNDLANACNGEVLAGLELANQPAYEAWRLGQQERTRQLKLRLLDELLTREDVALSERTALMRARLELDAGSEDAHAQLIAHLASHGQRADAEAQLEVSRRALQSIGVHDDARLMAALRGARPKAPSVPAAPLELPAQLRQEIRFCTATDGVRIAYATVGSGPPLVKTANWLNHLEFDWESPVWRPVFHALSRDRTFIRYDSRGNGLSDWIVEDLTLNAFVDDLKAVVDAAGVEHFPLFAMSQGCAVAVEFAVRYPGRVSKLILYGGYARGWRVRGEEIAEREAMITLTRTGWGRDNPVYRQVFTSLFMPTATPEQMDWLNELQRITTSPENAARIISAHADIDVSGRLAQVAQPTLVLHMRDDARVPLAAGRELAVGIPGARFVTLEGRNHLPLEQDPAWQRALAEVSRFLAE